MFLLFGPSGVPSISCSCFGLVFLFERHISPLMWFFVLHDAIS